MSELDNILARGSLSSRANMKNTLPTNTPNAGWQFVLYGCADYRAAARRVGFEKRKLIKNLRGAPWLRTRGVR